MTLVFSLGLGASVLFSYFEVHATGNDLDTASFHERENVAHLAILLPFILAALGLIWKISGWSLSPLGRASREAALIGPANPSARINADGLPREIYPVVEAVNGALERLANAYAIERRLTADAAHELRTPLAVLNLRLQRAKLSGTIEWPTIEGELAQMNQLVNQLLDLARKESLARQQDVSVLPVVNLSRIIREAAAMMVSIAEEKQQSLEVEVPDVLAMRGRHEDLRDMVRNLLDNALVHGQGTVRITTRSDERRPGSHVLVTVGDEGRGVPHGMETAVFERFYKLRPDSPGAGLGLAIVRRIVRSHGGSARFIPGCGRVEISLPLSGETRSVPISHGVHAAQSEAEGRIL
jgi:two-component system sensor histidine kinase QseC